MQILKAYADAGASGKQGTSLLPGKVAASDSRGKTQVKSKSGDKISISDEAKQLLISGQSPLSLYAQDATYDQYGNVTRQLDSLQSDIRQLAQDAMGTPGALGLGGRLSSLQSQIATLKAQV